MKAILNGQVIAESDSTIKIEGNHYFPKNTIKAAFFKETPTQTICPWKGKASYYSIEVNGAVNEDAAWYYPDPKEAAVQIKNHVAFWKGVEIEE